VALSVHTDLSIRATENELDAIDQGITKSVAKALGQRRQERIVDDPLPHRFRIVGSSEGPDRTVNAVPLGEPMGIARLEVVCILSPSCQEFAQNRERAFAPCLEGAAELFFECLPIARSTVPDDRHIRSISVQHESEVDVRRRLSFVGSGYERQRTRSIDPTVCLLPHIAAIVSGPLGIQFAYDDSVKRCNLLIGHGTRIALAC